MQIKSTIYKETLSQKLLYKIWHTDSNKRNVILIHDSS